MHSRLIAAGVGAVGYGVLVGWALTADYYEQKMKSNQRLLGDIIARQNEQIEFLGEPKGIKEAPLESVSLDPNGMGSIIASSPIEITSEERIARIRAEAGPEEEDQNYLVGEDSDDAGVDTSDEDAVPEGETEEETRALLQAQINQYTDDKEGAARLVDIGRTMDTDETPPYVISKMKYAWDEEEGDDYDKVTLTYYPRDRILLDDENEPIGDVANLVGWRNLSRFGDESEDADVVFIRNRRLSTDFEVVRDTENQPPAHVRFAMSKEEYETNRAAGLMRFRTGDK